MSDNALQKVIVETPRLQLYQLSAADAEHFFLLNEDPEVLKHTGDKAFKSIEDARRFLIEYTSTLSEGYGRLGVRMKSNRAFVGFCGLKAHPDGSVDLGFRIMKRFWNQGLATEASMACLDYGFNQLGLDRIIGRSMKVNSASIRVLEKIGMTFLRSGVEDLHEAEIYQIERSTFQQR